MTVSPSFILSKVTVFWESILSLETSNLDSAVAASGRFKSAFGFWPAPVGCKLLKSWSCPTIKVGIGLADWGNIFAVAVSPFSVVTEISRSVLAGSV